MSVEPETALVRTDAQAVLDAIPAEREQLAVQPGGQAVTEPTTVLSGTARRDGEAMTVESSEGAQLGAGAPAVAGREVGQRMEQTGPERVVPSSPASLPPALAAELRRLLAEAFVRDYLAEKRRYAKW